MNSDDIFSQFACSCKEGLLSNDQYCLFSKFAGTCKDGFFFQVKSVDVFSHVHIHHTRTFD